MAPATDLTGKINRYTGDLGLGGLGSLREKLQQWEKPRVLIIDSWARGWYHCLQKEREVGLASLWRSRLCVHIGVG